MCPKITCNYFLGADGFFSCKNLPKEFSQQKSSKAGPTVLMVKMIWILRTRMHYCALAACKPPIGKSGKEIYFHVPCIFSSFFSVICSDFRKPVGGFSGVPGDPCWRSLKHNF